MKKLFFSLFVLLSFVGSAQSITADPALDSMDITTEESSIIFTQLPLNDVIKLKVPIFNLNGINSLPNGTCKIKIGLGSKLILDPAYSLNNINTSNYFNWTAVNAGGQIQITGELFAPLPANFSDTAYFDVKGVILGSSTITTNFLVTNHNTNITLSDEDGSNNTASIPYIITNTSLPLTLTHFSAGLIYCKPNLKWITENEINTSHFEIERANNVSDWVKIGTVNAQGYSSTRTDYFYADNGLQNNNNGKVYYRLKMIDRDGSFKYSKILPVLNTCNKLQLTIYPNPVVSENINFSIAGFANNVQAILKTSTGEIVGAYTINNGTNVIDVNRLANGFYVLSVVDKNGNTMQGKVIIQK